MAGGLAGSATLGMVVGNRQRHDRSGCKTVRPAGDSHTTRPVIQYDGSRRGRLASRQDRARAHATGADSEPAEVVVEPDASPSWHAPASACPVATLALT